MSRGQGRGWSRPMHPGRPPGRRPSDAAVPPRTLPELFRAGAPADADAPLLTTPSGRTLSYGEAWHRSAGMARALAQVGVRRGDRVAVQVHKSPEALLLYLACARSGAVLVPMNPAYTDDEVEYLLRDAEPAVFVRDPERGVAGRVPVLTLDAGGRGGFADAADAALAPSDAPGAGRAGASIGASAGRVAGVRGAITGTGVGLDDHNPAGGPVVQPDELAAVVYTSGTTGRPKGAMLSHRNLASNAATLCGAWGFEPSDVLLHALPVFHVHGLFVAVNCVLSSGSQMIFLPGFGVDAVLDDLPRSTVFMGVPTYYARLLSDPRFGPDACRSVRLFVSGSAPMLASAHSAFRGRVGHAILERYGMSETSMITSNPLHGERRPGTVGLPLPGVEVRVVDDAGRPVGPGEIGGIEVRGPNVFSGYWRRPDLSTSEFRPDGFFRTGDVGTFDADGYLSIVGRSKDLIISGGMNVYPKEVEEVIDGLEGVEESAVIGVPDPDFGEAVVAVVVVEQGAVVDPDAMRIALRRRLAPFKVPKRLHFVDVLPRNAMGKIEKARLRDRFALSGPV